MRTNQAKWAFEKNVLYIQAERKGVISIYIDVEGEEYEN